MTESAIPWIALAVVLFWSVGAYNRLMRLRTQVIAAFGALDIRLSHYIVLVDDNAKAASGLALAGPVVFQAGEGCSAALAGLQGASTQFDASLRVARRQPLDSGAIAALQTAHATLQETWTRLQGECREHLHATPPSFPSPWNENALLATHAMAGFNRAVVAHNAAIAQFPALVLAHLFSFRPAAQCAALCGPGQ